MKSSVSRFTPGSEFIEDDLLASRESRSIASPPLAASSSSWNAGASRHMPRVSFFYGITIAMFWDERDHQIAHFHAEHAGHVASIGVDGALLAGELSRRDLALVREWAAQHRDELLANWQRARGVFEPLRDPATFAQVKVDTQFHTLTWPDGLDMAPEPLYDDALRHPIAGASGRSA